MIQCLLYTCYSCQTISCFVFVFCFFTKHWGLFMIHANVWHFIGVWPRLLLYIKDEKAESRQFFYAFATEKLIPTAVFLTEYLRWMELFSISLWRWRVLAHFRLLFQEPKENRAEEWGEGREGKQNPQGGCLTGGSETLRGFSKNYKCSIVWTSKQSQTTKQ